LKQSKTEYNQPKEERYTLQKKFNKIFSKKRFDMKKSRTFATEKSKVILYSFAYSFEY